MKATNYAEYRADIAHSLGFEADSSTDALFGSVGGYEFIITQGDENNGKFQSSPWVLQLALTAPGEALNSRAFRELVKGCAVITGCAVNRRTVIVSVKTTRDTEQQIKNLKEAINATVDYLQQNGYVSCCEQCGAVGATEPVVISGNKMLVCSSCYNALSTAAIQADAKAATKKSNVVAGAVGALLGSLIGVLALVIISRIGFYSGLSGLIMGVCVIKGYELLGGRLNKAGIVISCVIMVLMIYVGDRIDWAIAIMEAYSDEGVDFFTAFQAVGWFLTDGAIDIVDYIFNLIMLYFFSALGIVPTIIQSVKGYKLGSVTYRMKTPAVASAAAAPVSAQPVAAPAQPAEQQNYFSADDLSPKN